MDVGSQKLRKIGTFSGRAQPFRTKWMLDVKNRGKIATCIGRAEPFRTKWTLDVKNMRRLWVAEKLRFDFFNRVSLTHEMDVGHQKLRQKCDGRCVCKSVCG